ncbi:MAG: nitrite reductase (NAD(P)H) small subunit [Gorillibacterium sp.]|nr:nitrite reductase (NAD(P)H) small subunit [Gorillibacterium sp.]
MKKVALGKLTEIMRRDSRVIQMFGVELALFRLKTGEIRMIENECPLGGGKLSDGIVCDRFVFSPIRDYKISLDDGRLDLPGSAQLRTYSTEVDHLSGMLVMLIEETNVA